MGTPHHFQPSRSKCLRLCGSAREGESTGGSALPLCQDPWGWGEALSPGCRSQMGPRSPSGELRSLKQEQQRSETAAEGKHASMEMDPWCLLRPIPPWGGRVGGSAAAPGHNLPLGARGRRRVKQGGRREFALSDAGNLWGSPQGAPGREKSASFLTKAQKFSRCPLGFTALSEIDLCSAPPEKITGLYFRLPHTQMGRSCPHLPVTAGSSTLWGQHSMGCCSPQGAAFPLCTGATGCRRGMGRQRPSPGHGTSRSLLFGDIFGSAKAAFCCVCNRTDLCPPGCPSRCPPLPHRCPSTSLPLPTSCPQCKAEPGPAPRQQGAGQVLMGPSQLGNWCGTPSAPQCWASGQHKCTGSSHVSRGHPKSPESHEHC